MLDTMTMLRVSATISWIAALGVSTAVAQSWTQLVPSPFPSTLARRAGLLLRHTSLPPPARA